ncbi:MAG: hypothetical protein GXP25_04930 [Planctomycetes bacterium]|nr:hypothetical protein [Planctomycetota bacterium]
MSVEIEAVAGLIVHNSRTRKCRRLAGERCLAVPKRTERSFCGALRKMGYVLWQ